MRTRFLITGVALLALPLASMASHDTYDTYPDVHVNVGAVVFDHPSVHHRDHWSYVTWDHGYHYAGDHAAHVPRHYAPAHHEPHVTAYGGYHGHSRAISHSRSGGHHRSDHDGSGRRGHRQDRH